MSEYSIFKECFKNNHRKTKKVLDTGGGGGRYNIVVVGVPEWPGEAYFF